MKKKISSIFEYFQKFSSIPIPFFSTPEKTVCLFFIVYLIFSLRQTGLLNLLEHFHRIFFFESKWRPRKILICQSISSIDLFDNVKIGFPVIRWVRIMYHKKKSIKVTVKQFVNRAEKSTKLINWNAYLN